MKKKSKRQSRRLSVKELKRTAKDVSNWVDTTQPSRKKEDEVRLRERKEDTYVSRTTVSSDKSEELVEEPKRLDGGYAWIIVAFSFLLHFIADGLTFSFGQMFHSIVKKFDVNRMFGATIAGLFLSLPLMSSPFASVIGEHLGCRLQLIGGLIVSIFGILMALMGLTIESIVIFMIGFSVFLALGLALVYNGAIVILNLFFDKRLGLATALAVSGTGIGTIVFPQVIGQFENYFPGESATYTCLLALILCVIALFVCLFFIRDVEWTSDSVEFKRRMFEKRVRKLDRERGDEEDCYEPEEENYYARKSTSLPCVFNLKEARGSLIELGTSMQSIRESVSIIKQAQPPVPRSRSVGTFLRNKNLPNIPEYSMLHAEDFNHLDHLDLHLGHSPANTVHSKQPSRVRMLSKTSMSVDAINDMNDDDISKAKSCFSDSEDDVDTDAETESDSRRSNDGVSSDSELSDKVLKKNGILKNGTAHTNGVVLAVPPLKLDTSRQTRPSLGVGHQAPGRILVGRTGYRVRTNTNLLGSQLKMPSAPLIYHRKPKWHEKHEHLGHLWKALCSLPRQFPLYLDMLKNDRTCRAFALSVSFLYMVLDVPYVFFYDHAVENLNFTQSEGSDLTTGLGLASLLSTWTIGFLADRFQSNLFMFNGISMVFLGGTVIFASFCKLYLPMMASSVIFGAFVSSNYVLQSVLLTQLFQDPNKFAISYAMISMLEGAATFIVPPIIGKIRDYSGNYHSVFIVSGVILLISAFFSFYTEYLVHREKRNSRSPSRNSKDVPLLEQV